MKKLSIFILIVLVGCNSKKTQSIPKESLISNCERIIIMDSSSSKTINFLISFKNESNYNVVLFSNLCYKKTIEDRYEDGGMMLTSGKVVTPIGLYFPQMIIIPPNEKRKFFLSYSTQYPNIWPEEEVFNDVRQELNAIVNKANLSYKYNSEMMQKTLNRVEIQDLNAVTVNEDFKINIKDAIIEYRNNLTLEDAVKYTEGKVITRSL